MLPWRSAKRTEQAVYEVPAKNKAVEKREGEMASEGGLGDAGPGWFIADESPQ